MDDFQFASIIVSTIRNAPVLIFAAMAGLFAERSGVIDLALEGKILASAFVSAAVAFTTKNPWYGVAAGIGCSLALASDFTLAARSAYFLEAFVNIGLVPDGGATWMLTRQIGKARATEMMMLGERIPAEKAEAWGLIHAAVDDAELMARATALAERLAAGPTRATAQRAQIDQLLDFAELVEGDFVVHLQHGIALYRGLSKLDTAQGTREVITLEFDDHVTLHVPLQESHLISRYVGLSKTKPQLGRIRSGRREKARQAGLPVREDFGEFWRDLEWMGLQRHLKVAGIFARLTLRDGKSKYLADAPRFIHYIRSTCDRYRELGPLLKLLDEIEGTTPQVGFAYGRM